MGVAVAVSWPRRDPEVTREAERGLGLEAIHNQASGNSRLQRARPPLSALTEQSLNPLRLTNYDFGLKSLA